MLLLFVNTGKSFGYMEIFFFMFMLPSFVAILVNILRRTTANLDSPAVPETYTSEVDTFHFTTVDMHFSEPDAPVAKLTKEQQWNIIAEITMDKAMQGDKAARDWVTKHMFTDPVTPDTTVSPFISDAVDALKRAGYKPSDVRKTANQLCSQNDYASLEDLIQDIVKNC
jgi:hypothetical protein|tara:strand:- start:221 stop:727 length:507 start_codon:yes stop_codon:yes gene_type:complete